jgi:hypothetical protein
MPFRDMVGAFYEMVCRRRAWHIVSNDVLRRENEDADVAYDVGNRFELDAEGSKSLGMVTAKLMRKLMRRWANLDQKP